MDRIAKNITLLKIFNFLLDFRFYAPIAIIYFSKVTESFALGMSIFSAVMVTQTIFEVPMGVVSDYIGRKKTLIIGALFSLFWILFYATGLSYLTLLLGAICEGLSRTFFSGNNSALLYESVKQLGREKDFSEVSGKADSMFQLALWIAAFLSSLFALRYWLRILFWITALPQVMMVLVSLFIVEPKIHSGKIDTNIFIHLKKALLSYWKNKKLRLLVWSDAIGYGIGEATHELRPAFIAMLWPAWANGIFRGLTHVFWFVGFYFAGWFIRKFWLLKSLLMTSTIGDAVQLIALFLSNIFSPFLVALPSLSYGIERTASNTLQQQEFSEKQRATMGSLSAMAGSLIFAIIAVFFGWFADIYWVIPTLFLAQIWMISCVYLNYQLLKKHTE